MFKKIFSAFSKKSTNSEELEKVDLNSQITQPSSFEEVDNEEILISKNEIERYIKKEVNFRLSKSDEFDFSSNDFDPLFEEAAYIIVTEQQASASLIQRKLHLGYSQAGEIIDQLEMVGIVGAFNGKSAREVKLISEYQLDTLFQKMKYEDEKHKFFKIKMLCEYEDVILEKMNVIRQNEKIEKDAEIKNNIRREILDKEIEKNEDDRIKILTDEVKKELIEEGIIFDDSKLKREPIPQDILDKVWNRDGGKCVLCGSQEKIEFDHIIPFSRGGSNTYRNIQILCEKCNRQKSNKIG